MSVNLQKGQKVDLTKGNAGLKRLVVGLGWDEAEQKRGFLGMKKKNDIDCDASALVCAENGKLLNKSDIVYFGNLKHKTDAVVHLGDNLTGAGEGDDEQLIIELNKIPNNYGKIVFVVNIYKASERNQHFGMIKNAFIRIVDADTNKELCKYNLSENYDNMTAMIFGEVYRYKGEWKFSAIGQATQDETLGKLAERFL